MYNLHMFVYPVQKFNKKVHPASLTAYCGSQFVTTKFALSSQIVDACGQSNIPLCPKSHIITKVNQGVFFEECHDGYNRGIIDGASPFGSSY